MYTLSYRVAGALQRHELAPGQSTVGRTPSASLFLDHPSVSRVHAQLVLSGEHCYVTDENSRNGTYVNGNPVVGTAEVLDGSTVTFGTVSVHFEQSAAQQLALSDRHMLFESESALYRSVAPGYRPSEGDIRLDAPRLVRMVAELSRMLIRMSGVGNILDRIIAMTFAATGAERAFLILRDESRTSLIPRLVRLRDGSQPVRTSVSRTVLGRVMDEQVAMRAQDVAADPTLATDSVDLSLVRSFMCAPVWQQGDVIGAFYVDSPDRRRFSGESLETFAVLADYASIAIEQAHMTERLRSQERHRARLERYHSPAVVERILEADDGRPSFILQEAEGTVIFADIVGFTSMAEQMTAGQIARLLNRYLTKMTDVIFEHEGTIDKFIGDAILAVFGVPLRQPDHAARAVRAATGMRESLRQLNAALAGTPLQTRIAVHTGTIVAGDIGSSRRRDYTVIGDTVNTCARLQTSVCKPGQIVISRATYEAAAAGVDGTSLGHFKLKGRQQEIEVLEIS